MKEMTFVGISYVVILQIRTIQQGWEQFRKSPFFEDELEKVIIKDIPYKNF